MLVASPPPPLFAYAPERTLLVASVSKVLSASRSGASTILDPLHVV